MSIVIRVLRKMQYQIFVQNHTAQNFVASVVGIPIAAEGKTEKELIV